MVPEDIKRIIKEIYKELYGCKLDKLNAMDKFLDRHKCPKLTLRING